MGTLKVYGRFEFPPTMAATRDGLRVSLISEHRRNPRGEFSAKWCHVRPLGNDGERIVAVTLQAGLHRIYDGNGSGHASQCVIGGG